MVFFKRTIMLAVGLMVLLGGSALALQALSDQEMDKVAGQRSIHIGVGANFPFVGGADGIQLGFNSDDSDWFLEFIDRPNDSNDPQQPTGYPAYAYDKYQDEVALSFCQLDQGSSLLPASVLVPLELKLDMKEASGTGTQKPLLNMEIWTEYTSWPADPEPDFAFDMTILRKNADTAWYNDTSWQEGFEMHIDGITFLSSPYHDVDDSNKTLDGGHNNNPANPTPAMHLTLGSNNDDQGLMGELGMKLHLPGINLYNATYGDFDFSAAAPTSGYATSERYFNFQGVVLAGDISGTCFHPDVDDQLDFDGEFTIGKADSANLPASGNLDDQTGFESSPYYFPLTISAVTSSEGTAGDHAYIVIEACGARQKTVKYPVSNYDATPDAHPYYEDDNIDGNMAEAKMDYVMGDLRVGKMESVCTFWNEGAQDPPGYGVQKQNLGEQAVVVSDINVPYAKVVFAVDQTIDEILDANTGTDLTLIDNTPMDKPSGADAAGSNVSFGHVTAPPTTVNFVDGNWFDPNIAWR